MALQKNAHCDHMGLGNLAVDEAISQILDWEKRLLPKESIMETAVAMLGKVQTAYQILGNEGSIILHGEGRHDNMHGGGASEVSAVKDQLMSSLQPGPLPDQAQNQKVQVMSMSKVVTGFVALQTMEILQEMDGARKTTEFSSSFNPKTNVFDFAPPTERERRGNPHVTVTQCLTHMGGFHFDIYGPGRMAQWWKAYDEKTYNTFQYGGGYDVVGEILPAVWRNTFKMAEDMGLGSELLLHLGIQVENGTETPYPQMDTLDDVAKTLLFGPLGMHDTSFLTFSQTCSFQRRVLPSILQLPDSWHAKCSSQAGGASLETTPNDFQKFLLVLLNKGKFPGGAPVDGQLSDGKLEGHFLSQTNFEKWVMMNHIYDGENPCSAGAVGASHSLAEIARSPIYIAPTLGDASFGHSLICGVSNKTNCKLITDGGVPLRKFETPIDGKIADTLHWRGCTGSAWQIDFQEQMCFLKLIEVDPTMPQKVKDVWKKLAADAKSWYGGQDGAGFNHAIWSANVVDIFELLSRKQTPAGTSAAVAIVPCGGSVEKTCALQ